MTGLLKRFRRRSRASSAPVCAVSLSPDGSGRPLDSTDTLTLDEHNSATAEQDTSTGPSAASRIGGKSPDALSASPSPSSSSASSVYHSFSSRTSLDSLFSPTEQLEEHVTEHRTPTPVPASFSDLPLELVDQILALSLPDAMDERLEHEKHLSAVCRSFRAWAMPRMFPSSWTLGDDAEVARCIEGWRERPGVAACVKSLILDTASQTTSHLPLFVLEEVLHALPAAENIVALDCTVLNLRLFFSCQQLTTLHVRAEQLNWLCSGSLPVLHSLTIVGDSNKSTAFNELGMAQFFQPTTLPSLRELFVFLLNNEIGGRAYSSWALDGRMDSKVVQACRRLSDTVLRTFSQLALFEQNLFSPIVVGPFPPSPHILNTLFLGSSLIPRKVRIGKRIDLPDLPSDDLAKLDYLVRHFPSLTARHLRIQLSFMAGRKPWLVLAAEIVSLLPHPIFANLETLILPRNPLRDAEDWIKPRLDERHIRLEFEEMVNDDYWMEPSTVWRRLCAQGEEEEADGKS
ncbi:hypothetical protein JCM10207_008864 [Rhodosporidiobolus poonsookiae]